MTRFTYATLALLALSGGAAAASTQGPSNLGRVLAEAAASAPAPAPVPTIAKAAGSTIVTAGHATLANGRLTLKHTSPVTVADTTTAMAAVPASLKSIVEASKKGEAAYAVLSSAGGGSGVAPTVAVIRISDPVLDGDSLSMAAELVPAGSATPISGGAVEAALKAAGSAPAGAAAKPAALDADVVSLAIDNEAAPPAQTDGQKSIIGAAVGAGIGSYACGTMCAMGGAAIGSSVGNGYYGGGYAPVYYYG